MSEYGTNMKIQLGTIYLNRTRQYLYPIVKSYGPEFVRAVDSIFKVAVGIGDIIVNTCGIHHEKHLFLLCDAMFNPEQFQKSLTWLRDNVAYEDDYVFDMVHSGRLHMIVIKVPDIYYDTLVKFKKGEFSKMYSKEDIMKFFTYTGHDKKQAELYDNIQKVLIHDHNYKVKFAKKIAEEFNIEEGYPAEEIEPEQEFEFPILTKEEFFNLRK
jgi:hypothetical protein